MNDLELMAVAAQAAAAVDPHNTKSNPRVGCVVVENQNIIATGVHEVFGEAHAEVNALKTLVGLDLSLATIYITLEPCVKSSGKKTPACTDLLLKTNPAQVVIGSLDPHFPGQGVAQLEAADINVTVLNSNHHQTLNPWFETWITEQKTFITLKVAQSLDGKITPARTSYLQGSRALTGSTTQKKVHNMRALNQAILTSTETVLEDDPRLDIRHADIHNFIPTAPDVIVIGNREISQSAQIHKIKDRTIHFIKDLKGLIPYCQEHQIASIMTECGGNLNTQLLKAGLVDQIEIFTAPVFCGNTAKPSFKEALFLKNFKLQKTALNDQDTQLSYKILKNES